MSNDRISETKGLIRGGANVAISCALAASLTPKIALADEASGSSDSDTVAVASASQNASIDITEQWNAGGMVISEGGTYVLSGDVHSDGALVVNAPAGSVVVLDLAGHNVEVGGTAVAAIVADGSQGQVVVKDSAFEQAVSNGTLQANAEPLSYIRLVSADASESVAAVRMNVTVAEGSTDAALPSLSLSHVRVQGAISSFADGLDDSVSCSAFGLYTSLSGDVPEGVDCLNVALDGCCFEAAVCGAESPEWALADAAESDSSHAGIAASVYTQVKGISFSGLNRFSASSDAGYVHLRSTVADAFSAREEAYFADAVRVLVGENAVGERLMAAASAEQAADLTGKLVDATNAHVSNAQEEAVVIGKDTLSSSGGATLKSINPSAYDSAASLKCVGKSTSTYGSVSNPKEHAANALLSVAVEGSPLSVPESLAYLTEQSVNLSSSWKDKSQRFEITESGTYYLDSDILATGSGSLEISGDNIDVRIVLNGHTLDFDLGSTASAGITITGSANVSIIGGDASGTINFSSGAPGNIITQRSSGALSLSNVNMLSKKSNEYSALSAVSMHAIGIYSGNVTVEGCTLSVDESNLSTGSVTAKSDPYPCVIYDGRDSTSSAARNSSITLRDTTLKLVASSTATLESDSSHFGVSGYGVYLPSKAQLAIEGCTIDVSAPNGDATGVYAQNATVSKGSKQDKLAINVNGSGQAMGIRSTAQGGVLLNGPVEVSYAGDGAASVTAAFASTQSDAFKVGKGFSGSNLGVLVGSDISSCNGSDVRFATFDYELSDEEAALAGSQFVNALGTDAACTVKGTTDGVCFRLSQENAPVEVVSADGSTKRYANASEAFDACADGDTVRLLSDFDTVTYSGAAESGQTIGLDLNGHTISSLQVNSKRAGLSVLSSNGRGAIRMNSGDNAAVSISGTADVALSGLDISAAGYVSSTSGISLNGSGSLSLSDVNVRSDATNGISAGIDVAFGATGTVTLSGGSVTACATASATSYGIRVLSSAATVSVTDCPITSRAASAAAYGVVTASDFQAAAEQAESQAISAVCESGTAGAYGVRANGTSDQKLKFTNCAILAGASDDAQSVTGTYRCIDATLASKSTIQLDGTSSFASAADTAIALVNPLELGANFALAGQNQAAIECSELSGDVFAKLSEGCNEQKCAQAFKAAAGSVYAGDAVKVADGELSWSRESVARNTATGVEYLSVSAALAAGEAGQKIELMADATDTASIVVSKDATIDLAGHTWRVDVAARAQSGAISTSGDASLSICDSSHSGQLQITVGNTNETSTSKVTYSGLRSASTGKLTLDGVNAQVTYAGNATTAREVRTIGIYAAAGSVELTDSAKLTVNAQASESAYASSEAVGVYVGTSKDTSAVSVDESSSISVMNNAQAQVGGADRITSSTLNTSNPNLARITPDENSDLYAEIVDKFRKQATLDTSNSEGYGARVYYVNAMQLDDGTLVWAASNYVASGEEKLENIVPAVIFVQSTYAIEPQAIGIDSSSDAAGTVTVKGSVNAQAANGEACAVSAKGQASWTLDGITLKATGSNDSFQKLSSESIDLGDYLDIQNKPSNWFYPKRDNAHEVVEAQPESEAISLADGTQLTLSGTSAIEATGADSCGLRGSAVSVAESFATADEQAVTVGSDAGSNKAGEVIAKPAADSISALSRSLFKDEYGQLSPNLDASGNLIWEGPYTVTFHSDGGVVASSSGLVYGDSVALPSASDMSKADTSTTSYEFLGWATKAQAAESDVVVAANAQTVRVEGMVSYYPVYRAHAKSVSIAFSGARDSSGAIEATTTVVAAYGQTLEQAESSELMPKPADYQDGQAVYRFVGWRDSDGNVWDGQNFAYSVEIDSDIPGATKGSVSLSAYYVRVDSQQCLVRFKVDGTVTAYALDKGSRPSYYAATGGLSVSPSKFETQTGASYTFAGWHDGWSLSAGTADVSYASGASLPQVTTDVVYTACFSQSKARADVYFNYWQKADDGTWSQKTSPAFNVEYGSDVVAEANSCVRIGDTFTNDGKVYTMIGWSMRSSDKEPLYTDSIPFASTDSVTYFAVYSVVDQTATITFHDGNAVYAQTPNFAVSGTVSQALEKAGKQSPSDKSASRIFKGWSTSSSSDASTVLSSATVKSLCGNSETLDLYAVYGDAAKPTVSFADADNNLIGQVSVTAGTVFADVSAPEAPSVAGKYVSKWVSTSTGSTVDRYKSLTSDLRVKPKYDDILSSADPNDPERTFDGSADVSEATVSSKESVGAGTVMFMLENATPAETALESQATINGDALISGATYRAYYLVDSTKLTAASNIGTVHITVSCGSINPSSKVRVYWKRGDGSVGYTSALQQTNGYVSFDMTSYSCLSDEANLAVAEVGTGTSAIGNVSSGITSLSTVTPAGGSGSTVTGTITKTGDSLTAAGASASQGTAASLDTAAGGNDGLLSDTGVDTTGSPSGESSVDEAATTAAVANIAGNPLAWLVALIGASGIGAAAWWLLIGRKRKSDEEENEEAGWSDDASDAKSAEEKASAQSSASSSDGNAGGISF